MIELRVDHFVVGIDSLSVVAATRLSLEDHVKDSEDWVQSASRLKLYNKYQTDPAATGYLDNDNFFALSTNVVQPPNRKVSYMHPRV